MLQQSDHSQNRPWATVLVVAQVALSAALVVTARPQLAHWPWLTCCLLGIFLHAWSVRTMGARKVVLTPNVQPNAQLVATGPYRLVRHPMYSASLLFCGGFVLTPFRAWKLAAWCVLLLVLSLKASMEESQLKRRFPDYAAFAATRRRFIPFVW